MSKLNLGNVNRRALYVEILRELVEPALANAAGQLSFDLDDDELRLTLVVGCDDSSDAGFSFLVDINLRDLTTDSDAVEDAAAEVVGEGVARDD